MSATHDHLAAVDVVCPTVSVFVVARPLYADCSKTMGAGPTGDAVDSILRIIEVPFMTLLGYHNWGAS